MGGAKRQLELQQEHGWISIGKSVCAHCVTSERLRKIVEENATEKECDYCARVSSGSIAADTDHVMEHIGESIRTEYADPAEELPYETREGGYQGDYFDTDDLFAQLGEEIGCDDLVADVICAFRDAAWCDRDYFALKQGQALLLSWERFAELVKTDSRYLILGRRDADVDGPWREPHSVQPADMLTKLGELVVVAGLVRELPAGTEIYRARPQDLLDRG